MDWPQELLEIFEDPILSDVKPKAKPLTPDDRRLMKLEEIAAWVEQNGRLPEIEGSPLKERLLATALSALKKDSSVEYLKNYDRLNLL